MRKLIAFLICGLVFGTGTGVSRAAICTFGFYNITGNDPTDVTIGETQLFVDVSDAGANQVLFTFRNTGPDQSVISEIYFDDDSLLSTVSITDGQADVDFVLFASPSNLPGGRLLDPAFEASADLCAESARPGPKKGVNPGQQVGVLFDLQAGGTFQDVVNELNDRTLRIGIHVIGFENGGSESFVNVPEPAAIWLVGLGGLALLRKRSA